MLTSTKVKLYPDKRQQVLLEKHFGGCRFVSNYFLSKRDEYYIANRGAEKSSLNYFGTQSMLIELKKEYPLLYEINSQSLQMSVRFLDSAFKNLFHGYAEHPKFKRSGKNDCFAVPQHIMIEGNSVCFPNFSESIYFRCSEGKLCRVKKVNHIVITKDVGDYYCLIIKETGEQLPEKVSISVGNSVGIDLGVEKFATLSDGTIIGNPRFMERVENRIRRLQRQLLKRRKGSNKRRNPILKLQKKYRKLSSMHEDFLDKVSTAIAKRHDTIVLEDINVRGMVQNQHVSKGLADASFYAFRRRLEWKAHKYGENIILIGGFDPSSKLCANCESVKHDMKLSERVYRCATCGLVIHRDYNASKNIRRIGLVNVGLVRSEFTPVEIATSCLYGIYPYRQIWVAEAGGSVREGGVARIVHIHTLFGEC